MGPVIRTVPELISLIAAHHATAGALARPGDHCRGHAFTSPARRGHWHHYAAGTTVVQHLVRAGKAHLLIGLAENKWLEVKGGPYQINAPGPTSTRSRIELAQDVARFANGDSDAIP